MDRQTINCASCGQEWLAAVPFSVYEQQAVESCPCPHCGAYTLCCEDSTEVVAAYRSPRPGYARALRAG